MPKIPALTDRNLNEANRVRGQVPSEIAAQLKTNAHGAIERETVVAALENDKAWSSIVGLSPEQLAGAKQALVDYLMKARTSGGADVLQAAGLKAVDVAAVGPDAYAKQARKALLSYLPKEDVDSAGALKRYLKDPSYVHQLFEHGGKPHYISGFVHALPVSIDGHPARALQLDFHSLLEGEPPNPTSGAVAFKRFVEEAKQQGGVDVLFVEVTPEMAARYQALDGEFFAFAQPGKNSAGDSYTLLALPLDYAAEQALKDQGKPLFDSYVDSWFQKNLGANWQGKIPTARAAYDEMKQAAKPVWSQPTLPE